MKAIPFDFDTVYGEMTMKSNIVSGLDSPDRNISYFQ